jgi:TonB family protein
MTSAQALRRGIAVTVAGVLATILGAHDAKAQSPPATSRDSNAILHEVTVTTGAVRFTISRLPAKPVHLRVRTDSGTFTLSGDSAILARWADSAASLPEPPPFVEGAQVAFKFWGVKAEGDSGAHMRLGRLPTSHGADLALAVSNGVWGDVEYLGSDAPTVLAAIRGDSSALADTAHVKFTVSRAYPRPQCRGKDSLAVLPGDPQDSLCSKRHVEKQARQKGGSTHPVYPAELQRTGISGAATLAFVIDTTGRVDLASIQLVSSTNPRFAVACRRALSGMEFLPAQVDGRKVRELVQLPFEFKMH